MKRKYDTAEVQPAREQYVPVFEYIKHNGGRTVQDHSRLRHCTALVGTKTGEPLIAFIPNF